MNWDEELKDLTDKFVTGLDFRLRDITTEIEHKNWKRVSALAHQLKGAASSYGFPELSQNAKELELNMNENAVSEESLKPLIAKIKTSINHSKLSSINNGF